MCQVSADIAQKLEQTVRQFLDEGRAFTGYDVTIETREREKIKLRHQDVQGAVHEIQCLTDAIDFGYDSPNGQSVQWKKTQVSMGAGSKWAFVYHPADKDANAYTPRQTQSSPPPVLQSTPAPALASITQVDDGNGAADSGGENDDGTFSSDYRNRLLVPTRFLRATGLKPGDTVAVVSHNVKIYLVSSTQSQTTFPPHTVLGSQKVERNGDLRLSSKTLQGAGFTNGKFVIENKDVAGNSVVEVCGA